MAKKPTTPRSARGKAIVECLATQGLTVSTGAKKAGVSFAVMFNVIHHEPAPKVSGDTAAKLTTKLRLPMELVCPALAKAAD